MILDEVDIRRLRSLVRGALRSWHSSLALGESPLTDLCVVEVQRQEADYPDDITYRGRALREILNRSLLKLRPISMELPDDEYDQRFLDRSWRHYNILTEEYKRGQPRGIVVDKLGIGEHHYNAQERDAVDRIINIVHDLERQCLQSTNLMSSRPLERPGGAVPLRDPLYIRREADSILERRIIESRSIVPIRGPRQVGKTSLLIRGYEYARQHGATVVYFDLQNVANNRLESLDTLLHYLAIFTVEMLDLNVLEVNKAWSDLLDPQVNLGRLLRRYILPQSDAPLVLVIDEADRLLQTSYHNDFFGMLRAWYNEGARGNELEKLNIIMVVSTEPHLLISDPYQSPFNVQQELYLEDFNEVQVRDLNERYGSPVAVDDLPEFFALLNGHPYLSRLALHILTSEKLTWENLAKIAIDEPGPFDNHLRRYYQLLQPKQNLKEALKQVIRDNSCADDMASYHLLRAGLIKEHKRSYICRCNLYRRYFEAKLL